MDIDIIDSPEAAPSPERGEVPRHALLLSLLSLWVPILSSSFFPQWTHEDVGILIWLLALIPAFLLSFYKGWRGASLALAGGMAAFSVAQVVVVVTDATLPRTEILLGVAAVLLMVALGTGWISSHLHKSLRSAEEMALTDATTGLPNRRHALLFLKRTFEATRRGGQMAVVLFDLDHFKRVNDEFGHATGDEVLVEFAGMLNTRARSMDLPARFGGEEFLAILPECDATGAFRFAEDVRESLENHSFSFGKVTVSAGLSAYEAGMAAPEVLVAAADQALYQAKSAGRNQVCRTGARPGIRRTVTGTAPETDDSSEQVRGDGELILVVDDEDGARNAVGKALRRFGYEVLLARHPDHAVEIFTGLEQPVDLILTDVIMPPTSGFRLVDRISTRQPDLRVIYMSGYVDEDGWDAAPGTVRGFLQKPFSLSVLTRKVRQVLDAPLDRGEVDEDTAEEERAPVTPEEDQASTEAGEAGPSVRTIAILAPSSRDADALEYQLRHLGYDEVWTGVETGALLGAMGLSPDLLLVQTRGSVEDQMARLREVRRSVDEEGIGFPPILALVDERWPDLQWQAQHLGAFDWMEEPHDLDELGVRVGNLLRLQEAYRDEREARRRLEAKLTARTAELEAARTDVLLRLARAAEFRDDLTGAHAERVGLLSGLIAREMNQDRDWCETVQRAAPLHDVGKIAVPDAILNKPADLTPAERRVMESHTTVGSRLLSGSRDPMLQCAEKIALHHHEAWDGSGYPSGLEGDVIPLSARIVTVADVFDSLSHTRPYREANTRERSVEHVRKGRGSRYDPRVVDAFLTLVRSGGLDALRNVETVAADARPVVPPGLADGTIGEPGD